MNRHRREDCFDHNCSFPTRQHASNATCNNLVCILFVLMKRCKEKKSGLLRDSEGGTIDLLAAGLMVMVTGRQPPGIGIDRSHQHKAFDTLQLWLHPARTRSSDSRNRYLHAIRRQQTQRHYSTALLHLHDAAQHTSDPCAITPSRR